MAAVNCNTLTLIRKIDVHTKRLHMERYVHDRNKLTDRFVVSNSLAAFAVLQYIKELILFICFSSVCVHAHRMRDGDIDLRPMYV